MIKGLHFGKYVKWKEGCESTIFCKLTKVYPMLLIRKKTGMDSILVCLGFFSLENEVPEKRFVRIESLNNIFNLPKNDFAPHNFVILFNCVLHSSRTLNEIKSVYSFQFEVWKSFLQKESIFPQNITPRTTRKSWKNT